MYGHKVSDYTLELDACLTGLGGCWGNFVFHLTIPQGYLDMRIVHLEMANILVAIKTFAKAWNSKKVLIKCDNQVVADVLRSGRAKDPFLGACAHNIWYVAALEDIDVQYVHVFGKNNRAADLLSRWSNTLEDIKELHTLIVNPVWVPVNITWMTQFEWY